MAKRGEWDFLFHNLATFTKEGRILILLDEINWMATKDPSFLGKLKTAWDTLFKQNPHIIMILSGSLSGWIEKNILSSTGFFGRVDLDLELHELPLEECNHFWEPFEDRTAPFEKFKMLCVTGGVPRYLEALNPKLSAEENIRRLLSFKEDSLPQSPLHKKIIELLAKGPADQEEILYRLGLPKSGFYSKILGDLVEANIIARDYMWSIPKKTYSKLSKYRLSDNFLNYCYTSKPDANSLPFKNLVLNNRHVLYRLLSLKPQEILLDNPYFQRKTKRHPGVQIDYMIQTTHNTLYLCEIKFSQHKIGTQAADEMEEKLRRLPLPKGFSTRAVLIHVSGTTDALLERNTFTYTLDFSTLLT